MRNVGTDEWLSLSRGVKTARRADVGAMEIRDARTPSVAPCITKCSGREMQNADTAPQNAQKLV